MEMRGEDKQAISSEEGSKGTRDIMQAVNMEDARTTLLQVLHKCGQLGKMIVLTWSERTDAVDFRSLPDLLFLGQRSGRVSGNH